VETAEELIKHCLTLGELEVRRAIKLKSQQIYRILSTSPRLVRFEALAEDSWSALDETHISAQDFIHLDSFTSSLTPWPCESTLKVLRARISGILRPGVTKIAQEQYSGQRINLQRQVYGRLARFTNLERLELGHEGVSYDYQFPFQPSPGEEVRGECDDHVDCLDMSLDSGLAMLEGLTKLRELSIQRMATSIGVEEVKWMIRHWPNWR
jgi:hypothetical protein